MAEWQLLPPLREFRSAPQRLVNEAQAERPLFICLCPGLFALSGKVLSKQSRTSLWCGPCFNTPPPPPRHDLVWIPICFGSSLQLDWSWSVNVFISAWPCLSRRYLSYAARTFPWPWLPGPLIMWPVPQSTFASALRQRTHARRDKQSHSVRSPSWVKCPFKTSEAAHYLQSAVLWVGIDSHHLTHYELFSDYLTTYYSAKQPVKTTTSYWSIYDDVLTKFICT